ncbi:MAG: imidazole glycerol phosphate synthase subunit HisF [Thermoanaerobaculia bacterium]|nr:imidazole glycerol phosphate synthase subunit HisF [Thermoanaerobaculia bacterium]
MTLAVRLIPCLDIDRGRVVKGLRFQNIRDAGDPVQAAERYEREGADELIFLDITASHEERGTLVNLVERIAEVLSIPFTVGGGVRSVEDAGALLRAGADRVTVNTAALADPSLITRIAERYGSQCVVVAIDAKRVEGRRTHNAGIADAGIADAGIANAVAMTHGGRRESPWKLLDWVREVESRGAGEILLTSVDTDGTKNGFDVEMLEAVRKATTLPLIASGGAGELSHFSEGVRAGADAVLAASVFHDRVFSIREVKAAMRRAGVVVRPVREPWREAVRFNEQGLVPVIVQDARSKTVLTLAWANEEALDLTLETRASHFFSRSRRALWKKGESSGNVQEVVSVSLDCDGDAVLYSVIPAGPACHTGALTCFHEVEAVKNAPWSLDLAPLFSVVRDRKENPQPGSYTNSLFSAGPLRIAKKVGEEGVEVALAAVGEDRERMASEIADLLYHVVVLMTARDVPESLVEEELRKRRGQRRGTP